MKLDEKAIELGWKLVLSTISGQLWMWEKTLQDGTRIGVPTVEIALDINKHIKG